MVRGISKNRHTQSRRHQSVASGLLCKLPIYVTGLPCHMPEITHTHTRTHIGCTIQLNWVKDNSIGSIVCTLRISAQAICIAEKKCIWNDDKNRVHERRPAKDCKLQFFFLWIAFEMWKAKQQLGHTEREREAQANAIDYTCLQWAAFWI